MRGMNSLGREIKRLREEGELTVRELAEKLHKSPGYISRIEVRDEIPSAEFICELAKVLGVAPQKLMELAKKTQLQQFKHEIETRQESALALYRKEKR